MDFKKLLYALPILAAISTSANAANQILQERVEVVFVLDTTSSMVDLIDGAKRKIWSIASTIVETNPDAEIAIGLVAFRDRGDAYVVQTTALSEDMQGIYSTLIKLEAEGGNDTPESVNEALDEAIKGLRWTSGQNVKRIVFLVGDAPPHMDYPQERQYPTILKEAVARGIVVNAVQAGDSPETTPIWQEIAQYGKGRFIAIPQTGGEVVVIITPYDDDLLQLQRQLDETVVPYGNESKQKRTSDVLSEKAAAPNDVKLDSSKYYSKRELKKEVLTGGGDLIADLRNKDITLDKIAEAELPKDLQGQSAEMRQTWLDAKLGQRTALETKIAAIIAKRDSYVLEQQKKATSSTALDSFDRAVEDTLRSQLN